MKTLIVSLWLVYTSCVEPTSMPRPEMPNSAPDVLSPVPDRSFGPSVHSNAGGGSQYQAQNLQGQYSYGYAITDGTHKSESRQPDGEVTGTYGYMSPNGQRVELSYTAGQDGFKVTGAKLPYGIEPTQEVQDAARHHALAVLATQAQLADARQSFVYAHRMQSYTNTRSMAQRIRYSSTLPVITYSI